MITVNFTLQTSQFVASSDVSVPTVAFISPGPNKDDVLYVGTVDLGPGATESDQIYTFFRRYTCGVSSRRLTGDTTTLLAPYQTQNNVGAAIGTYTIFSNDAASKRYGDLKYVSGFGFNGFSYFLSIQPAVFPSTSLTSVKYVSRLAQVCQRDINYDSFFETNIQCFDGIKNYNLVQSTVLLNPGLLLATAIGLNTSDHVMLAVFYSAPDSALCLYKMADVSRSFTNNLQTCFNASSLALGKQYYSTSSSTAIGSTNKQCGNGSPVNIQS
jgi:Sema domain